MSTVRLRRLTADFDNLSDYIRRHPRLRMIQADGDPPERYQLEYLVKSLQKKDEELKTVKKHIVEIALPRNYPRTPPQCRMLTPVFHPNIAPHAICVGDHWSAGESLEAIVIRIGEMLAYQVYNVKSPLNGEAARWVQEHESELPLDEVSMLAEDPDDENDESASAASVKEAFVPPLASSPRVATVARRPAETPVPDPAQSDRVVVACGQCARKYRVPASLIGRTTSCKNCGASFSIHPLEA